jgi:hypothetical protein
MTLAKIAKTAKAGKEILGFGTEILLGDLGERIFLLHTPLGLRE